jgi:hypothetical protein
MQWQGALDGACNRWLILGDRWVVPSPLKEGDSRVYLASKLLQYIIELVYHLHGQGPYNGQDICNV